MKSLKNLLLESLICHSFMSCVKTERSTASSMSSILLFSWLLVHPEVVGKQGHGLTCMVLTQLEAASQVEKLGFGEPTVNSSERCKTCLSQQKGDSFLKVAFYRYTVSQTLVLLAHSGRKYDRNPSCKGP